MSRRTLPSTHYVQVTDRRNNEAVWRFRSRSVAMLCAEGAALSPDARDVAIGQLGAPCTSLLCAGPRPVTARLQIEDDDGGSLDLGFATAEAARSFSRAVAFSQDVRSVAEHWLVLHLA